MASRSQEESEQPAKVYQLDAVEAKVNDANAKLDRLLQQTSGLVTESQLGATKRELEDFVADEINKIHLEYGPLKRNISWFIKALIVEGFAIIGQIVILIWVTVVK